VELNYQRCPEDPARVIGASIEVPGLVEPVELGIAEITTCLHLKGSIYGVTLAVKNGVTNDFVSKVAAGLAQQMGDDIHALCPVIGILCECFALLQGGKAVVDDEGLIGVEPSKDCPAWMRGYIGNEEHKDGHTPGEEARK